MNKLNELSLLARNHPVINRFIIMYELGEYKNLEECLFEMVIVLTNLNNTLQNDLYKTLVHQRPSHYVVASQTVVEN